MAKGHMIFGLIMGVVMALTPLLALGGGAAVPTSAPISSYPQTLSGEEEGVVQVLRSDTGKTEEYSLADYLFGVVAAEMPMSYHDQALKAQCVAAHTLYLHKGGQNTVISDDSATAQAFITKEVARAKWGERAAEHEKRLTELVEEVINQVVLYQNQPALTVYHALCAGRTESAQNVWGSKVDYLVPVESVGDVLSSGYISKKEISKAEFLQKLNLSGQVQWEQALGEVTHSSAGLVLTARVFGKEFTGGEIRTAFSLRSANFDMEVGEETVTFTVRGYGHQVGMSQFGANTMAGQGSDYKEILEWYYKGCTVEALR